MALVRVGDDAGISSVMDLFDAVKVTKKKSDLYESVLESMESKLTILIPIVREKNQLNEVLHRGTGEIQICWETIKKGAALVRRCSEGKNACCGCFERANYMMELKQLDESLQMFCNAALQTQRVRKEVEIQPKTWEIPCELMKEKEILLNRMVKNEDEVAYARDRVQEVEIASDTSKEVKDIIDTLIEAKDINVEVQFIRQSLGRLLPPGKTSSTPPSSFQPLPPKQQQAMEEIMQVKDVYAGVKLLHAQIKQIYEEMERVRAERERLKALTTKMKKPIDDEFDDKEADSLRPRPQELQVKDIQQAVKDIHADVKNIRDKMEAIHGDIHPGTKDTPKLNIPAAKIRGSRAGAGAESYQGMVKDTTSKQATRKNEQLEGVPVEVKGITKDLDPSNSTMTIGTVSDPNETAFQPQWMAAKMEAILRDIHLGTKGPPNLSIPGGKLRGSRAGAGAGAGAESYQGMVKDTTSKQVTLKNEQLEGVLGEVRGITTDLDETAFQLEGVHGEVRGITKVLDETAFQSQWIAARKIGTVSNPHETAFQLEGVPGEVRGVTKDLDETAFQPQWMAAKPQKLDAKDIEEKMKGTTGIGS